MVRVFLARTGWVALGVLLGLSGCENRHATTAPTTSTAREQPHQPSEPQPVVLLHANDLDNWTFDLEGPPLTMADVWSIHDGVLSCKGKPAGVLRTKEEYGDYRLDVEWRWPPGTPGGNNGVLVHASTPRVLGIWPKSVEVQLQRGDAGDFWIIGTSLHVPDEAKRKQDRRYLNLTDNSEKPMGEWNHFEIVCRGNEITVRVNGDLVNHATDVSVTRGAICLQSEGVPIEYRNIVLTPLH